jgi:hypothetical protein
VSDASNRRPAGNRHLDRQIRERRLEHTIPIGFSADETTDVGKDTGSRVVPDDGDGPRFTGDVNWVATEMGADERTCPGDAGNGEGSTPPSGASRQPHPVDTVVVRNCLATLPPGTRICIFAILAFAVGVTSGSGVR